MVRSAITTLPPSRGNSEKLKKVETVLVDVSHIFYFFCLGRGKGESEAPGRGRGSIFYSKSQEGGRQEGEGPRGREGVCGKLGNGGGGAKYFFSGPKCPPSC